ncbi:MAG: hypothetical protein PUH08_04465 [Treponema sp.]|nr:hypothetical protein [Treponema sp.]MDY3755201.1 hypothetical protein [Treponema sp.]
MTWAVKMADARYDGYDEGYEKGISIGLEQGLEQGAYQTKLETARKLITMGLSIEQVVQGTGLPIETVMGLRQET